MTLYSKRKTQKEEFYLLEDIEKHIKSFVSDVCNNWSIEQEKEIEEMMQLELKHFGFSTL